MATNQEGPDDADWDSDIRSSTPPGDEAPHSAGLEESAAAEERASTRTWGKRAAAASGFGAIRHGGTATC